LVGRNVGQIGIANRGMPIPSKHGIDGLAELHQIGFIYAARVDPDIFQTVLPSLLTASPKLDRPDARFVDISLLDIAESELFEVAAPSM
jgi:hypothetical protein